MHKMNSRNEFKLFFYYFYYFIIFINFDFDFDLIIFSQSLYKKTCKPFIKYVISKSKVATFYDRFTRFTFREIERK
jgi:hypothetical protein